jgi:hypothetical protein
MALDNAQIRKYGGLFGIIAVAVYVLGSLLAIAYYPTPFSPLTDWTSDIGNYDTNPRGAIIYNTFAAIAGLLLLPFFASIGPWYDIAKDRKFFYMGAELFGILAAMSMAMQAIFQQGTGLHKPWSTICLISLTIVLLLANGALFRNPKFIKPIGYYGFLAVLAFLVFFVLYAAGISPFIMEWIAVYGGLLWILLFSYNAMQGEKSAYSKSINSHKPI